MTNVVKGDQVKDSYGKIYDVIEVHEHNVMVLEPGKPYWERICMGRFDFDSYFRRIDVCTIKCVSMFTLDRPCPALMRNRYYY